MTATYYHAQSSARVFGGVPEDYIHVHNWFDETKTVWADFRHRALRHHSFGIAECIKTFGETVLNSAGKHVPVRYIAEQHILEDCGGKIPTVQDWLEALPVKSWMARATPTVLGHRNRQRNEEDAQPG